MAFLSLARTLQTKTHLLLEKKKKKISAFLVNSDGLNLHPAGVDSRTKVRGKEKKDKHLFIHLLQQTFKFAFSHLKGTNKSNHKFTSTVLFFLGVYENGAW